jgi:hypothetical protein
MRRTILSAFAITIGAINAHAADRPVQSGLGAIFEESSSSVTRASEFVRLEVLAPVIPYNLVSAAPWARGGYNYGSSWSYHYSGPYYGGFYDTMSPRLPYTCGLYGYC